MLHDLYKSAYNSLDIILKNYSINSFKLLKNNLKDTEADADGLAVLIMISLGTNLVLNLGFTSAIRLIMRNQDKGQNLTNLMYHVGKEILNQCV